jgi:uncharacterized protein
MPNVVFDASSLVGAVLKFDSTPERALRLARAHDIICMSDPVEAEIRAVFSRPKFVNKSSARRIAIILDVLMGAAAWYSPTETTRDCRDAKDNKYLELAFAAAASTIVSSDYDLLVLNPWRGIHILRPADYVAGFGSSTSAT